MLDLSAACGTTYESQNDALLKWYLNRTFFNSWRYKEIPKELEPCLANYRSLELQLNAVCDLKCKYCYQQKYADTYYENGTKSDPTEILNNTKMLLDMIEENQFYPNLEIFSGDPLMQNIGCDVIEEILSRVEAGKPNYTQLSIPTNMSFLTVESRMRQVEEFLTRAKACNFRFGLSASVDGPYMESNRPGTNPNFKRDAGFYDRLFTFMKRWGIGLHPMIYSEHIEKWIDNFEWFQKKMEMHDIPWYGLYLLEVRNEEWTEEQCGHLYEFMKYLVHWLWTRLGKDFSNWKKAVRNNHMFNIINSPFSQIGRGLGCSVQSSLQVRMGDLSVFPCHRQMYPHFKAFQFVAEDGKITGVKAENIENYIMVQSAVSKNQPGCESCVINEFCSSCCPGSAFETTGDAFSPIPTVCRAEFFKLKGIVDGLKECGILAMSLDLTQSAKRERVIALLRNGVL